LGWREETVIERLRHLLAHGELVRFGPLFRIERAGGCLVLAALAVPQDRFADVAHEVARMPELVHLCQRDHPLNMWLVVAADTPILTRAALDRITATTWLPVLALPRERDFSLEPMAASDGSPGSEQ
jgi:DNA-binding Lrp family transcriptional regulator